MSNPQNQTTPPAIDISEGRSIEVEIGWFHKERYYEGTISYPPDGENAWTILHEECGSLKAVRSGLQAAIQLPAWPCRYCSDWILAQTC